MDCPHCNKTISLKDSFCRHCGKPITEKERRAALAPPPMSGHIAIPIEKSDFGPGEILAQFESGSDSTWGAHIYTGASKDGHEIEARPDKCPEWVEKNDWPSWFRRGITVWDGVTHRIGAILAGEALALLSKLRANDEWRNQGIPIIERHETWLMLDEPSRPKRKGKKKLVEPEPPAEAAPTKPKFYEQERLRLVERAAQEFFDYLQDHEKQLQTMADEEARFKKIADQRIFEIQLELIHQHELREFEKKSWKFPWARQAHNSSMTFMCDIPPDRATIRLMDNNIFWQPIIERPGRSKWDWERFVSLEKAINWVEAEIPRLRAEDEAEARQREQEELDELARIAALPTMDLAPFWIAPATLEPKQAAYRAFIDLECGPYKSRKEEISFGEFWHWDKEFYTPTMLARELRLNPNQLEIQQLDEMFGMYHIYSKATYYEGPLVAAQAQQIWEQSLIGERFGEGKIVRARYGYEELEIEYHAWLGQLEPPNATWHWPSPETRAQHLVERAMRETLLHALDVNGFRKHIKMRFKYMSDDDLLERMHHERMSSPFQSAEAKFDSERWLREHNIAKANQNLSK